MKRQTTKQKLLTDKHKGVVNTYASGHFTTEQIAEYYQLTVRQVQRIAKKNGVIRSLAEANKLMAPLKRYKTVPAELRVKRKQLPLKQRYAVIAAHPYCTNCGRRPEDGVRLEVDHIDENPMNNAEDNLQVLCGQCNTGKSHLKRFD